MKKIKAVIIDDEQLAREDLIDVLNDIEQLEITGEASNLAEAKMLLEEKNPDVIFLDIQLKGESGFDLLPFLNERIAVIFVTAFDEYAFKAFEADAEDYLLKPVKRERVLKALSKIKPHFEEQYSDEKFSIDDSIFILLNKNYQFLRIRDIVAINSAGDYSELLTSDLKKSLTGKSLREWEERLPEKMFCRIHRSSIINLSYVEKVEEWFNQTYNVKLKSIEKPYLMSKNYALRIKKFFS